GVRRLVRMVNRPRGAGRAAVARGMTCALLGAPVEKRRRIVVGSGGLALAALLFAIVCARCSHAPWVASNRVCVRLAYFFQTDRNSSGWYRLDMWRRVGTDVAVSPGSLLLGYGP